MLSITPKKSQLKLIFLFTLIGIAPSIALSNEPKPETLNKLQNKQNKKTETESLNDAQKSHKNDNSKWGLNEYITLSSGVYFAFTAFEAGEKFFKGGNVKTIIRELIRNGLITAYFICALNKE